jgi:hypothetical protein
VQPSSEEAADPAATADPAVANGDTVPPDSQPPANGDAADPAADATADPAAAGDSSATGEAPPAGPTGEGWVIELEGHHFHNKDRLNRGAVYVKNTLIRNLENAHVDLPVFDEQGRETIKRFSMKELGIDFAVIVVGSKLESVIIGEETSQPTSGSATVPPATDAAKSAAANGAGVQAVTTQALGVPKPIIVDKFSFIVQFCWKETPASARLEKAKGEGQPKPTSEVASASQPAATKQEEATP